MLKRGVITFVFDDGYEKVYQNAVPLLRQHHMPAVFAIPIDGDKLTKAEQRAIRPWPDWLPLAKEGFEIASHSVSHPNLTTLQPTELDRELAESSRKLSATTIVYPGGAVNDEVADIASQYYTAGRTVHYGIETLPPREPMRLRSYNFSRNNWSLLKANLLVIWAFITNSWLIETFHMIDEDDDQMLHTVKTSQFSRHLNFVNKLPVAVKTISEVVTNH